MRFLAYLLGVLEGVNAFVEDQDRALYESSPSKRGEALGHDPTGVWSASLHHYSTSSQKGKHVLDRASIEC